MQQDGEAERSVDDENRLFTIADEIAQKPDAALSPAQQTFRLVWELEAEVNNGGFRQYFFNSSGRDAPRAQDALRLLGANKCADIVSQALKAVDLSPADWDSNARRQSHLESMTEDLDHHLDEMDERFFGYPDPLSELLTNFVAAHPEEFSQ